MKLAHFSTYLPCILYTCTHSLYIYINVCILQLRRSHLSLQHPVIGYIHIPIQLIRHYLFYKLLLCANGAVSIYGNLLSYFLSLYASTEYYNNI